MARERKQPLTVVGWREWVGLPALSEERIKAKMDTGARTGALHAFGIEPFTRDGEELVRFGVHPRQGSRLAATETEQRVLTYRMVRSSTGHEERRPVIRTPIEICGQRYEIDLTLTSRDEMGFRLLIGRAALRGRFLVDPGRSFVGTRKRARSDRAPIGDGSPEGSHDA